jgi:hypothetical protein
MRRLAALVLGLAMTIPSPASALPLFGSKGPKIIKTKSRIGDWQLQISRNPFSGQIACRLRARNKNAFYMSGAVGFRFKRKWNVADAVYRLDGGAPQQSRDDLPELRALNTPMDRGGMDNASQGIVWIPFAKLMQANSVAIAPRRDRKAKIFHYRGLKGLHEIAVARGCASGNHFVER